MSSCSEQRDIDYRFKLFYAFGIFFVVSGHCDNGGVNLFYNWFPLYSFHLAIFVFSSGYFYKEKSEDDFFGYCLKKIKNLLIPLYLWNFIYAIIITLLNFEGFRVGNKVTLYNLFIAPLNNGHQFGYNLGSWFIIPLFMVEIFNIWIRKFLFFLRKDIKDIVIFVLFMAFGIVGNIMAIKGFNTGNYLILTRFLFFLPFFALGTLYKNKLEKFDNLPNCIYFGLIFFIQLVIIYIYKKPPSYTPSWCRFPYGPIIPYISGVLGIFFWFRICKILTPAIGKNRIINSMANNTFSIMINHLLGFMIFNTIFAFCCKHFNIFTDFNFTAYRNNVFYWYCYKGLTQTRLFYVVFAIWFSVIVQKIVDLLKIKIKSVLPKKLK